MRVYLTGNEHLKFILRSLIISVTKIAERTSNGGISTDGSIND